MIKRPAKEEDRNGKRQKDEEEIKKAKALRKAENQRIYREKKKTLSDIQLKALRTLKGNFIDKSKQTDVPVDRPSIAILGEAGTGKSYLLSVIVLWLKYKELTGFVTASTGIAADNLRSHLGGECNVYTLHSWSGTGVDRSYKPLSFHLTKIKSACEKLDNWLNVDVLIIDEISMITPLYFSRLDEIAKSLRGSKKPFGGIQLVLSGDWAQLSPIADKFEVPDHVRGMQFIYQTKNWENAIGDNVFVLKNVFRQSGDTKFLKMLNEIRYGYLSDETERELTQRMIISEEHKQQILQKKAVVLVPLNKDVEIANDQHLNRLPSKPTIFRSYYVNRNLTDDEFARHKKYMAEEFKMKGNEVTLKVGAVVILTVNVNVRQGFVNGSQGVIESFDLDEKGHPLPVVQFRNGSSLAVDYWPMYYSEIEDQPYKETHPMWKGCEYRSMPLQLAAALSIHRCQGMEFESACVDIGDKIFTPGQAYTAISRVKSLDGLFITNLSRKAIKCNPDVVAFYKKYGFSLDLADDIKSHINVLTNTSPSDLVNISSISKQEVSKFEEQATKKKSVITFELDE